MIANNPNIAGWFHNHPSGGESTSDGDSENTRRRRSPGWRLRRRIGRGCAGIRRTLSCAAL